jgi:hypothetical protein
MNIELRKVLSKQRARNDVEKLLKFSSNENNKSKIVEILRNQQISLQLFNLVIVKVIKVSELH